MRDVSADRPATLTEYLAILKRRKWILITLPLIAALVAFEMSKSQPARYEAKTEVIFSLSNIPAALSNLSPVSVVGDPATYLATQAEYARSFELAQRVVAAAGVPGVTAGQFLGESSANVHSVAYILDLSVTSSNPDAARLLANAYAREFTRYKADLDTKPIASQLRDYRARLNVLRANGQTQSPVYQDLIQKQLLLETLGGELANNTTDRPADGAAKTGPRPTRNAILGFLFGAVLGFGLAFFAEALDKRVRSEQQIGETLGIPLLGRVPRPTRRLRKANRLVMLAEPSSVHAQTFRRLRTSLEFVNFEQRARIIMVTSALPREGKSTTVANLAIALARAGRRVALADLDLRRPFLHSFFDTGSDHGFTDVVVDRVKLDRAIRPLALPGAAAAQSRNGRPPAASASATNGRVDVENMLHVLPAGSIPPAADEFLERERVSSVLEDLSVRFDIVLVDTPPLMAVGDAMALSTKVDAIVVVTRVGIQRPQLEELARQLHNCRAPILGFVLTGASHGDSYSYGYGYDQRAYERQEAERAGEQA